MPQRSLPALTLQRSLRVLSFLQISPELADLAAVADLIVLEGMGRSIETNLHVRLRSGRGYGGSRGWRGAALACVPQDAMPMQLPLSSSHLSLCTSLPCSCDQLNVGMVKHPEVAAALGGRMLDCVCQLRCAAAAAVGGR